MNNKPKTIFCDLDGTLIKHCNPVEIQDPNLILEVLEGTHDKLREWDNKGYTIISKFFKRGVFWKSNFMTGFISWIRLLMFNI